MDSWENRDLLFKRDILAHFPPAGISFTNMYHYDGWADWEMIEMEMSKDCKAYVHTHAGWTRSTLEKMK